MQLYVYFLLQCYRNMLDACLVCHYVETITGKYFTRLPTLKGQEIQPSTPSIEITTIYSIEVASYMHLLWRDMSPPYESFQTTTD